MLGCIHTIDLYQSLSDRLDERPDSVNLAPGVFFQAAHAGPYYRVEYVGDIPDLVV